jgi:uncharacterized protein (UPF0332 family)
MTEIDSLLTRSHKYLASARALIDLHDHESAVSRTYYAMFYAVEALLLREGQAFSSHKAVLSAFSKLFVKTGVLPREMARDLSRAFQKRQLGDYEHQLVIEEAEAISLIEAGEQFVARIEAHLK